MDPVPSVHFANWMSWKLLRAGLNNEERIKRLRGTGKDRETVTIGNSASITAGICYPSKQVRQSTGTAGLYKVHTMKRWKGTRSARASIVEENIFADGNPVWRLYGLGGSSQLMPPVGQVEGRVVPENRERARTSESNILTSVSGLCHLLAVEFGADDFTSLKHPALHLWSEK